MSTAELHKDCISGVKHEGEPQGKFEKIGGYECYVATPSGEYAQDKVILFLTDIFGLKLDNNLLLADNFALRGYKVIAPDILRGDPIPWGVFSDPTTPFDLEAWFAKHESHTWIPAIDSVAKALKDEHGVTKIGTTGYCFGAPAAFYLACKNESRVTVVAHPAQLDIPADFEKYKELSKAPLLINSCEVDSTFPKESQAIADTVLGDGKFAPGYEQVYWEGCRHGFAIRGDMNDPKVKAGKEGAFEGSVKFYEKHL